MSKVLAFQKHSNDNITVRNPFPGVTIKEDIGETVQVKYTLFEGGKEVEYTVDAVVIDSSSIPQSKVFREAWEISVNSVAENLEKARTIAHEKRRAHREKLLEPHDKLSTSPIASVKANANAAKQAILDADAPVQTAIDAAGDVDTLKQVLVDYGAV